MIHLLLKRLVIYGFILITAIFFISFSIKAEEIIWSKNRPLAWDDFKGEANPNSNYKANTNYTLYANYRIQHDSIFIEVIALFNKNKSWVKEGAASDYLLKHEQGHFNIAEIYARKIRKRLISSFKPLTKDFVAAVKDSFRIECSKFHGQYDIETDHSKNVMQQHKWELKIYQELSTLEEYSSYSIKNKR